MNHDKEKALGALPRFGAIRKTSNHKSSPPAAENQSSLADMAAEINREHVLAVSHAERAIDHAKKVGKLLIEVKDSLPHGEYLPFVKRNLAVSVRQAQRYVDAAMGKGVSFPQLAHLKCDIMSYLPPPPKATPYIIRGPACAFAQMGGGCLLAQESATHPGFYDVAFLGPADPDGLSYVDVTERPVLADGVEQSMRLMLPEPLRSVDFGSLEWGHTPHQIDPEFVRKIGLPWPGDSDLFEATQQRARAELQRARKLLDDPSCDIADLKSIIDIASRWERTLSLVGWRASARVFEGSFALSQVIGMPPDAIRGAAYDGTLRELIDSRIQALMPGVPLTQGDCRLRVRTLLTDIEWCKWSDNKI
ncbi:MAG: hypothetical protein ACLPXB_16290, partial [Thiobacillaceae bacterium]